jgi:hypothetical protein
MYEELEIVIDTGFYLHYVYGGGLLRELRLRRNFMLYEHTKFCLQSPFVGIPGTILLACALIWLCKKYEPVMFCARMVYYLW